MLFSLQGEKAGLGHISPQPPPPSRNLHNSAGGGAGIPTWLCGSQALPMSLSLRLLSATRGSWGPLSSSTGLGPFSAPRFILDGAKLEQGWPLASLLSQVDGAQGSHLNAKMLQRDRRGCRHISCCGGSPKSEVMVRQERPG